MCATRALTAAFLAVVCAGQSAWAQQYWDGPGPAANNVVDGGSGAWDATTSNWTNALGSSNMIWTSGGNVVFGGVGGTVTFNARRDVRRLEVTSEGYTIGNFGAGIIGTSSLPLELSSSVNSVSLNAQVEGSTITKTGAGNVLVSNGFVLGAPGNIDVQQGILEVASSFIGTAGTLQVADGASFCLKNTGNSSITYQSRPITISGSGASGVGALCSTTPGGFTNLYPGAITMPGNANAAIGNVGNGPLTLQGAISGSGVLSKVGTGEVIIRTASPSFTGTLSVNTGTLTLETSPNALSSLSGITVASGATLGARVFGARFNSVQAADGTLHLGNSINIYGDSTLGNVTGTGSLTVKSGTLTLSKSFINRNLTIVLDGGSLKIANGVDVTFSTISTILTNRPNLDFALGSGRLTLSSLIFPNGGGLNVINHVAETSRFYVENTINMIRGSVSAQPGALISINGFSGSTYWAADNEMRYLGDALYFDGNGTTANNLINSPSGGSAPWDDTTTNWTTSTGNANSAWVPGRRAAIWGSESAEVAVSGTKNVKDVELRYTLILRGGALENPEGDLLLRGGGSIESEIKGTSVTSGDQGIILAGANTFTGPFAVSSHVVYVRHSNALGSTAGISIMSQQGSIELQGGLTLDERFSIAGSGAGGAAFRNGTGNNTVRGTVTMTGAASIGVASGTTLTFEGALAGSSALTKIGTGTLSLAGAGTLSNAVTVSAGTLRLNHANALSTSSGVTVSSGATLEVGANTTLAALNSSNGTLALGANTLTLSGNSTLGLVTASPGATIVVTGGTLTLTQALPSNVSITLNGGNLNVGSGLTHSIGTLTIAATAVIDFNNAATNFRTSNLVLSAPYNLNISLWEIGGTSRLYATQINGSSSSPQRNTAGLPPLNQITFNGSPANNTYWDPSDEVMTTITNWWDGTDSSGDGVVDGGSGTWNASNTNWTTSNGQTNDVWPTGLPANFTGTAGTVTVSGSQSVSSVTLSTTGYVLSGGTLTNPSGTLILNSSVAEATVGSALTGGAVSKTGAGTVTINGTNTFTAAMTVASGTLVAAGGNSLGASGASANTVVSSGATLGVQGGISLPEPLNLSGTGVGDQGALQNVAGENTISGTVALAEASSIGVTAGKMTISGVVSGSKELTKVGSGNLILSTTNTFTGALTVSGGTLIAASNTALGTNAGNTKVDSGSSLGLDRGGASLTSSEPLILNGSGVGDAGALINLKGANTLSGAVTVSTASSIGVAADTSLTMSGAITSGSTVTLKKVGSGTLTLSGTNSPLAGVIHVEGGRLITSNVRGLGDSGSANTVVSPGASLGLSNNISYAEHVTISGAGESSVGALYAATSTPTITSSGSVTLADNATIGVATGTSMTVAGVISGNSILTKGGVGTLTLTGANTLTGAVMVSAGTLQLGNQLALSNSSGVTLASSTAKLSLSANSTLKSLDASLGTVTLGARTLTLSGDSTLGTLESSGGIIDVTGGTLTLTKVPPSNTKIRLYGGSLKLGSALTLRISSLTISADASIDFNNTASSFTTDELVIAATGAPLLDVVNWVPNTSRLIATLINNSPLTPAKGTSNLAPLNQISMGGRARSDTQWLSSNSEISVPLPRTHWDGPNTASNGAVDGGVGTWDNTGTNWTTSDGAINGVWAGGDAYFTGTAGAVSIVGTHDVTRLDFSVSGYSLTGGTLGNTSNPMALHATSGDATVGSVLQGTSVGKTGTGTVTLTGSNTFSGAATVSAGILRLNHANALSTSSGVTVGSGATLEVGTNTTLAALNSSNGTLVLGANTLTLSGNSTLGLVTASPGATIVVTGGTLTLTQALPSNVSITLNGGNLNVGSGLTHSIGTLTISDNAVIDFNNAATSLTAADLVISAPRTLTVSNWTRASSRLYATSFAGAVRDTEGQAPMNLIKLGSYPMGLTVWRNGSDEIDVKWINPMVRIVLRTVGGVGGFSYQLEGLSATTQSIASSQEGVDATGAVLMGESGQAMRITQNLTPAGWPADPQSVTCVDANGGVTGNGSGSLGTLDGRVLSLAGVYMPAGADITCNFTNQLSGLSGRVFNDGGAPSSGVNSGTPNDGLRNGAEAGLGGVVVSLSNCAGTVHASATTDASGQYSLSVPSSAGAGSTVCVSAQRSSAQLPNQMAIGASVGTSVVADGASQSVSGVSYSYERQAHQLSFVMPAALSGDELNFAQVPLSSFGPAGNAQGAPNTSAFFAHNFVAGTGGQLGFEITSEDSQPVLEGWKGNVYADPSCTGNLQPGAALLYPGSASVSVVQGQTYCVVVKEFIPVQALGGNTNDTRLKATLVLANAATLSASYQLSNRTTVSTSALRLQKEVRNITRAPTVWGSSNQARPGDELEYRITYTNISAESMSSVAINDQVPTFTSFVSALAQDTPAMLGNCTKLTPAKPNQAEACDVSQVGAGLGPVVWSFSGQLNPGASGMVLLRIKLD